MEATYAPTEAKGISPYVLGKALHQCARDHFCEVGEVLVLEVRQHGKTHETDHTFAEVEFEYLVSTAYGVRCRMTERIGSKCRAIYGITEDGVPVIFAD